MKKLILPVTLLMMALLETACSGGSSTPTASQNACWSSAGSNVAACNTAVANATAYAEVPSTTSKLAAATTVSNPAVAKSEVGLTTASVNSSSSTSDEAIKAQSIKIQSALQTYANNPDSSYYDPATTSRKVASTQATTDIAPASVVASAPVTQSLVESSLAEENVATTTSTGATAR